MYHLIPLFVVQVPTVSELSPPFAHFQMMEEISSFLKRLAGPCLGMPEQSGKNFEGEFVSNLLSSPLLISKITK